MTTLYERKLLNRPEVRLAFSDPLRGIIEPQECELVLDNTDRYFDTLTVIGERVDLHRFDRFSAENQWELSGLVTSQEYDIDSVRLRVVAQDLAELQTLLPRRVVTAALFPLAHPTLGLGKPIPIIIGNAGSTHKASDAWEMAYVGENVGANEYDYLVGDGTFASLTAYRTTVGDTLFTIPGSEYTVNTSAYPGFTVLRFPLRQSDFGGSMDRLFVAANSVEHGRNGVTAFKTLLNNSSYGLGLSVNATSFTDAAADWDAVGGLYVDMAITEQRPALDWLNEISVMRGLWPEKNTSGEWTMSVMKSQSVLKAILGHGREQDSGGVVRFGGLRKTPMHEAVKTFTLEYRYNQFQQTYALATTSRSPFSYGKELREQNRAIRDRTTGDKVASFLSKRLQYGGDSISTTGDMRCRNLRPGNLFTYDSLAPVFKRTFMVQGLRRDILRGVTDLDRAVGWDSDIFVYDALTLPAEPADITETDYTRQTPTAASSLSIASSGVEADGQGGFAAFVVLQYTIPAEPWAITYIRYRRNGATNWQIANVNAVTGAGLQTKITGLITGASYDYAVSRVNAVSPALAAADATLTAQTAPVDAVAPGAPTSVTVSWQQFKTITITFTPPADRDFDYWEWEIRTAASGGGSLVASGTSEGRGAKITINVSMLAYSTTRYLRVRGVDYTGNTGSYSASTAFSLSQITTDDVGADQITTPKIPVGGVTASGVYTNDSGSALGSSEAEIGTITISGEANQPIMLIAYGGYTKTSNPGGINVKVRKTSTGGTILGQGRTELVAGGDDTMTVIGYDATPAASQTYKMTGFYDGSAGGDYYNIRLIAIHLKR